MLRVSLRDRQQCPFSRLPCPENRPGPVHVSMATWVELYIRNRPKRKKKESVYWSPFILVHIRCQSSWFVIKSKEKKDGRQIFFSSSAGKNLSRTNSNADWLAKSKDHRVFAWVVFSLSFLLLIVAHGPYHLRSIHSSLWTYQKGLVGWELHNLCRPWCRCDLLL
jgi:hypothetical protein